VPKGGPDGGDGGRGGSMSSRSRPENVDTLLRHGRPTHHWRADNGETGRSKSSSGSAGDDLTIRVPPGTIIYDDETGELLDDLDTDEQDLMRCRGRTRRARQRALQDSPRSRRPAIATPGEPGEHANASGSN
jgi:GTP-binding protein